MSTVFDLHDHLRRLRTTFSYFKNASCLTGEELQKAQQTLQDGRARAEWESLLGEIRTLLLTLERMAPKTIEQQPIEITRPNTVNLDCIYALLKSRRALH